MKSIYKDYKPYLLTLSLILVINIIFFTISNYYGLQRSWINVDYFLLFLFIYYKNKINDVILFITLFLIISIDVLLLVLQIFPFIQLNDLIYLSTFVLRSPALYQIFPLICFFMFLLLFYIFKKIFGSFIFYQKQWGCILIFLLIFNGLSLIILDKTMISSYSYFFIKHRNTDILNATHAEVIKELNSESLSKTLLSEIKENNLKSKKILFIMSESWSETAQPEQQQAILAPIYQLQDKLEFIHRGSFSVIGATVMGEIREMCQKSMLVVNPNLIPKHEFHSCIPNLLKQQNYKTYSLHVASDKVYDRNIWYPLIGLDERYFFSDLPESQKCVSFDGGCDIFIKDKVKQLLLSSDKSFVYWLTLNSHAPYDDKIFIDGFDCEAVGLRIDTAVCNNYKLHYQFFTALAQLIADPELQGLEIYVVGDHPAPVANLREGLMAFKGSDVAWLHLKLK